MLTPHEFVLMLEGANERELHHQQDLIYLAWHVEAFARQKRLPKLQSVLKQQRAKVKKSLPQDELIRIAKSKGLQLPKKYCD